MCGFNCVYHDLLLMLLILIYILTQTTTTIKCAFLRDKKVILLLILSGNTNPLLDLKHYHMQNTQKLIIKFFY